MTVERISSGEDVALVDLVDRLIGGGVVLTGDVVLSLAGVDLVYLGLRVFLTSVATLDEQRLALEGAAG